MKVIYLHQYFNTADSTGGTRSYEFSRRLARDGHEVHVITSDRTGVSESKNWSTKNISGIHVHSIAQPYSSSMRPAQRLWAFIRFAVLASVRARSLRGDVVFATSTPLTIAIPGMFATYGRQSPLVMEIRDLWPEVPIAMGYLRNPVARRLALQLEKLAYRRSKRIVALSEDMATGVASKGFNLSKITVIPNLSDIARFRHPSVDSSAFYDKYPQLNRRRFVVYTGAFGQVNGVEFMASLAKQYRRYDPELAFVAMGNGARRDFVTKYASEIGVLDDNFFVLDPVPKKDLPTVLAAATACCSWVMPIEQLAANSANKFFDGLAAGRPVLINHGGWQSDLLKSSGAGLSLPESDVATAAQLLHEKLSDAEWLRAAGAASASLGETRFEAETSYRSFLNVLTSAQSQR